MKYKVELYYEHCFLLQWDKNGSTCLGAVPAREFSFLRLLSDPSGIIFLSHEDPRIIRVGWH